MYAPTANDGNKDLYSALLRNCEGSGAVGYGGSSITGGGSTHQPAAVGAAAQLEPPAAPERAGWQPAAAPAAAAAEAQQQGAAGSSPELLLQHQGEGAMQAAAARMAGLSAGQRQALLHGSDIHAAVEELLGMRLFLGGISHKQFHSWAERTGFLMDGSMSSVDL